MVNEIIRGHIDDIESALELSEFHLLRSDVGIGARLVMDGKPVATDIIDSMLDACDELKILGFNQLSYILRFAANMAIKQHKHLAECDECHKAQVQSNTELN